MEKKGFSRRGFFGETIHYDEKGNEVGKSYKNVLGGYDHYDASGNKTGSSYKNMAGGTTHYDAEGEIKGSSYRGFGGQTNHYDSHGNKVGESTRSFIGGLNHYTSESVNVLNSKAACPNEPSVDVGTDRGHIQNSPNHTQKHYTNGFDELLITVAVADLILFLLGAILRWDDVLTFLIIFIISLTWYIIRNK